MSGSRLLEIGASLFFVYWLVATVCSALQERIAAALDLRARDLESAIRHLLEGPPAKAGTTDLAARLYDHGLIRGLRQGRQRAVGPSYIPARLFALALFDVLCPTQGGPTPLDDLRAAVAKIEATGVRTALLCLIDDAQGDLVRARANVELWFNDAMDRVTGWYRRRAQLVLLGIALAITVCLNLDTVAIADALARQEHVRIAVIAAADAAIKGGGAGAPLTPDALDALLAKLSLPIGWSDAHFVGRPTAPPAGGPLSNPTWVAVYAVVLKAMGLAATALAASFGAPFWFDLLNKVTNLRSAGTRPAPPPAQGQ